MAEWLGIPADLAVQGGAVGLLGLCVLMIFTGRLVPLRIFRQLEKDRDYWREAALKAMGQTDELIPGSRIAADVAAALHRNVTPALPVSEVEDQ